MRFHVLGLPHTVTSKRFLPCAYTQKIRNFCRMMTSLGHEVFHYGAQGVDLAELCDGQGSIEHIDVLTNDEQRGWWGEPEKHIQNGFSNIWDTKAMWWTMMNARSAMAIAERARPGDFLCVIAGVAQQSVASMLPHLIPVEYGVGYTGVFAKCLVFESRCQQYKVHGQQTIHAQNRGDKTGELRWDDGSEFETVIPNYFDPEDFRPGPAIKRDMNRFLFIGRVIKRKGIAVAAEACRSIGATLVVAGQGGSFDGDRFRGDGVDLDGSNIEYVGTVTDPQERANLYGSVAATFVPTRYLEPFGGVFAESLLCGTPAICSNWGAFPEFVTPSFLCDTQDDFNVVAADVKAGMAVDQDYIMGSATHRFSLKNIARQYQAYFRRLQHLHA